MPGHYGMSFGERGRGGSAAANQELMDQHMANVFADPGPSQAEIDRANRENAAIAATVRMEQQAEANRAAAAAAADAARYQAMADYFYDPSRPSMYIEETGTPAVDFGFGSSVASTATADALAKAQATDEERQAAQIRAMMVGTPEMGFTPGQLASGPGAYFARYGPNAPAVLQYINKPNPLGNVLSAITGLNTPQEDLRLGLGQPVFNSKGKLMGELSTNAFGGVVYGGTRFDPGEDHPFRDIIAPGPGHGGYDSSHEDQYDMVVPPVTNPATGRDECPEGYIFDEDLQACRLDTRSGTTTAPTAPAAPVTPGAQYARMGLLDVAPEGLMGFRERYGAGFGTPSDFGAANLAFRRQAAISPEYFQTPPKLTGYTLL